jgi:hypothetical protein
VADLTEAGSVEGNGSDSFHPICLAGWINREQQAAIEYLREEIRVLKEYVGPKRFRFTDEQRRRLAAKAKKVKFGRLKEIANLVTPQTLLNCFRRLMGPSMIRASNGWGGRGRKWT